MAHLTTLDTSAGRASLPLVASSQPTIPIVFEFITGSEFILAPGLLQDHGVGFYAEPVPKGRAWLIFAALSPPLFVRLERRGAVFGAFFRSQCLTTAGRSALI